MGSPAVPGYCPCFQQISPGIGNFAKGKSHDVTDMAKFSGLIPNNVVIVASGSRALYPYVCFQAGLPEGFGQFAFGRMV
jgi:hypothetical protein